MRTPSNYAFDLRSAVDGIRDSFTTRGTEFAADGRPERRDIRSAILIELAVEPMHGYQLIGAIESRSAGTWKPTPGAVYPTLQLLEDEALVTSAQVGERKVYSLTPAGRTIAAETVLDEARPSDERRSRSADGAIAVTKAGAKLAQALAQVAQAGSADQAKRAAALVDETRRKVYGILAED